jgi:hypothetical protein
MFKKLSTQEQMQKERQRNLVTLNNQIELALNVSEREIQEIVQGRQISDLEIQLLELQGGM